MSAVAAETRRSSCETAFERCAEELIAAAVGIRPDALSGQLSGGESSVWHMRLGAWRSIRC